MKLPYDQTWQIGIGVNCESDSVAEKYCLKYCVQVICRVDGLLTFDPFISFHFTEILESHIKFHSIQM